MRQRHCPSCGGRETWRSGQEWIALERVLLHAGVRHGIGRPRLRWTPAPHAGLMEPGCCVRPNGWATFCLAAVAEQAQLRAGLRHTQAVKACWRKLADRAALESSIHERTTALQRASQALASNKAGQLSRLDGQRGPAPWSIRWNGYGRHPPASGRRSPEPSATVRRRPVAHGREHYQGSGRGRAPLDEQAAAPAEPGADVPSHSQPCGPGNAHPRAGSTWSSAALPILQAKASATRHALACGTAHFELPDGPRRADPGAGRTAGPASRGCPGSPGNG